MQTALRPGAQVYLIAPARKESSKVELGSSGNILIQDGDRYLVGFWPSRLLEPEFAIAGEGDLQEADAYATRVINIVKRATCGVEESLLKLTGTLLVNHLTVSGLFPVTATDCASILFNTSRRQRRKIATDEWIAEIQRRFDPQSISQKASKEEPEPADRSLIEALA